MSSAQWNNAGLETASSRVIDEASNQRHDHYVTTAASYVRDRRSSRIFKRLRIAVSGRNRHGQRFREACETIVINAHGGLLYASQELDMGALVTIINPDSQDEQECRVVYLGENTGKGLRIGLEFLTPSPHFWGVEFGEPDWSPRPAPSTDQQPS
jgi:hypothetical protein